MYNSIHTYIHTYLIHLTLIYVNHTHINIET